MPFLCLTSGRKIAPNYTLAKVYVEPCPLD